MQQFFTSPIDSWCHIFNLHFQDNRIEFAVQTVRGPEGGRDTWRRLWRIIMVNGYKKPSRMEVYDIFLLGIYMCILYTLIWDDSKWLPTGLLMGWFMIGFTHQSRNQAWLVSQSHRSGHTWAQFHWQLGMVYHWVHQNIFHVAMGQYL